MSPSLPQRPLRVQPDARLLQLARHGETPAFEALVRRYRRPLLGYCRRLGLADAQAEDALQQGLLHAWRALCRGDEVRDVKSWVYRVVHNAALDVLRRPGRDDIELDEGVHTRPGGCSTAGELDRRLAVHAALTELAALPDMQREALVRTAVHGDSHEQVASALGLSQPAVRGLVHRARLAVRAAAGALVPGRVLEMLCGAAASGPDLGAAGGGSGMLAALVKGSAVIATGGIIATGLTVVQGGHGHPSHRSTQIASAQLSLSSAAISTGARPIVSAEGTGAGALAGGGAKSKASDGALSPLAPPVARVRSRHDVVTGHEVARDESVGGVPTGLSQEASQPGLGGSRERFAAGYRPGTLGQKPGSHQARRLAYAPRGPHLATANQNATGSSTLTNGRGGPGKGQHRGWSSSGNDSRSTYDIENEGATGDRSENGSTSSRGLGNGVSARSGNDTAGNLAVSSPSGGRTTPAEHGSHEDRDGQESLANAGGDGRLQTSETRSQIDGSGEETSSTQRSHGRAS